MKIVKIADGAYFVPSYSEQTITRSYDTRTTIQSFGYEDDSPDKQETNQSDKDPVTPVSVPA